MPDTKVALLTQIQSIDASLDFLPIVDVSDTTMAASGTTKKVTTNQILQSGNYVVVPSGSSTQPALSFSNDGNSGIYSPSGDQVSISAGGSGVLTVTNSGISVAGTGAISGNLAVDTSTLFVDAANNRVGIGTATPVALLSVQRTGTGSESSLLFSRTSTNVGNSQRITWQANDLSSLQYAEILGTVTAADAGQLEFKTASAGALTLRATLDSSGNLGLGVTPSAWGNGFLAFQVNGPSIASNGANRIQISTNVAGGVSAGGTGGKYATANPAARYEQLLGNHYWYSSNDEIPTTNGDITFGSAKMHLDINGNLGLAVTPSGNYKLEVAGGIGVGVASSSTYIIAKYNNELLAGVDSTGYYFAAGNNATSNIPIYVGDRASAIVFKTSASTSAGTERLRINSSGNLGLGVTPSAWNSSVRALQFGMGSIYGNPSGANDFIIAANTYLDSGAALKYVANGYASRYLQSNGRHIWQTGGITAGTANGNILFSQSMTLDAAGQLGLGVDAPEYKLDIRGAAGVGLQIFETSTATNKRLRITQESAYVKYQATFTTNGNAHSWWIGENRQMDLDSSGNLGLGVTPAAKFDLSAGTYLNLRMKQLALDNWANEGIGITMTRTSSNAELMAIGVIDTDKLGLFSREGIIFSVGGAALYSQTSQAMFLDTNGNLGLGVTPSAWSGGGNINLPGSGALAAQGVALNLGANYYIGSDDEKFVGNGRAAKFDLINGAFAWYSSANNTFGANASLSWGAAKMTLSADGNLGVGVSPSAPVTLKTRASDSVGLRVLQSANGVASVQLTNDPVSAQWGMFSATATAVDVSSIGAITFSPGAVLKATLDASGNLGIGQVPSTARLTVHTGSHGNLGIVNGNVPIYAKTESLTVNAYRNSFVGQVYTASATGFSANQIVLISSNNTTAQSAAFGLTADNAFAIYTNGGNAAADSLVGAERFRIEADGSINAKAGINIRNGTNGYELNVGPTLTGNTDSSGSVNLYTGGGKFWHTVVRGDSHPTTANWWNQFYYNGSTFNLASAINTALEFGFGANPSAGYRINVNGASYLNGNLFVTGATTLTGAVSMGAGSQIRATDGSTSSPGISFVSDQNTGLFSGGVDIIGVVTNGTERARVDNNGNVVVGTAALATNATNGFLYIPSCAGTPTGNPTAYSGRVPLVWDSTNDILYVRSGGSWKQAVPAV